MASQHKNDPLYADGYLAGLQGTLCPTSAPEAFRHGWRAAREAKCIITGAGFSETAPGQYSKSTTIRGASQ